MPSRDAALAGLARDALRGPPLDDFLEGAVQALRDELGADFASFAELTGDGQELRVRAGAGLPGHVLESGQPVLVEDLAPARPWLPHPSSKISAW